MSQRTRARTTASTTHSPSEGTRTGNSTAGRNAKRAAGEKAVFSAQNLARTLRAVADELEHDPELARRISSSLASSEPPLSPPDEPSRPASSGSPPFRPRLITGTSPELGTGIPDPFALFLRRGEKDLRAALEELRLGTLRAIIREHHLDPQGKLAQQNDAAKLRKIILEAVLR